MGKKSKRVAYVVFHGRTTGVFSSWVECEAQVKGYSKANFQGFESKHEAVTAWEQQTSAVANNSPSQIKETSSRYLQEIGTNNPSAHSEQAKTPNFKRPSAVVDLPLSDDEEAVVLTCEQKAVVNMALGGENIFLTGAAGSGKTVTLKEILRRFTERKVKYQVVAPTGIAALPLGGKTTYSFLGWGPDSLSKSISDLQKGSKKYVKKAVESLGVLIIEEISMVENQFLERMNLVLQSITEKAAPFGGLQVIFLGDFHQLPPVKPFQFCLRCGKFMSKPPVFACNICSSADVQYTFTDSDKWAFKSPVWSSLNLRMVQLQQIHRQKDDRFQDILNKIRNGIRLNDDEWHDLEKDKTLPPGIRAVRLMSRRWQVDEVNSRELGALKAMPKEWEAFDSYQMLDESRISSYLPWENEQPLKQNRLSEKLTLKVGAKVVLLVNLGDGLVNGSQGEVIDFKLAEAQTQERRANKRSKFDKEQFQNFEARNATSPNQELFEPVVRFANGTTRHISAITSTTMYGTNEVHYLASRTQVPLALAWALSIHKSQGMTLDYVEISSRNIFERGQLYVALSRGTTLDGLIVTGTSREQLEVDSDVVEFYENNEWEDLSAPAPEASTAFPDKELICLD